MRPSKAVFISGLRGQGGDDRATLTLLEVACWLWHLFAKGRTRPDDRLASCWCGPDRGPFQGCKTVWKRVVAPPFCKFTELRNSTQSSMMYSFRSVD